MKSLEEDYEICKSAVSDLEAREDLLSFLSFYTFVIYHVGVTTLEVHLLLLDIITW